MEWAALKWIYILSFFVLGKSNIAQGHFGESGGQWGSNVKVSIHQETP